MDSGYDITDHNSIHPKLLGDDGDIDKLIKEAHEKGDLFYLSRKITNVTVN